MYVAARSKYGSESSYNSALNAPCTLKVWEHSKQRNDNFRACYVFALLQLLRMSYTRKVRRRLLPACSLDWDMKGSDFPVLYLLLPQNLDLHTRVKVTTSLRAVPREVLDLDANLHERINQLVSKWNP